MFLLAILIVGVMTVSSQATGFSGENSSKGSPVPPKLVERVDAWEFIGPMDDYEYDLYRETPGGYEYVPPPDIDYVDPIQLDYPALRELAVATDQIDPASREVDLQVFVNGTNFFVGTPMVITFQVNPATKTVILEGGTATATVEIWPDASDAYVAIRNRGKQYFFMNAFSCIRSMFFRSPVAFAYNAEIDFPVGVISVCWPSSATPIGEYVVFAVLVPPGADVTDSSNWISSLAFSFFKIGIR